MEPVTQNTQGTTHREPHSLKDAAQRLEAAFLSELLKSAGVGKPMATMGGGIGEDQFSSYLRDEYAKTISESGGIGLAEIIFQSLREQE